MCSPGKELTSLLKHPLPTASPAAPALHRSRGGVAPRGRLSQVPNAGTGEDGGRGLLLVAALAKEWGTAPRPGAPGKTVWAVVPAAPVRG